MAAGNLFAPNEEIDMTINKTLLAALVLAPLALGFAAPSFSAQPIVIGGTQVAETQEIGNAEVTETQTGGNTEVGEAQANETQVTESAETGEAQESGNEVPDANESGEQSEGNSEG